MDVAVDRADFAAEYAFERDGHRIQDGDLEAALAGRGGDLGADPAGADHHDRAAAIQSLAQRVGILDAAQVQDAVEVRAGDREAPRLGAIQVGMLRALYERGIAPDLIVGTSAGALNGAFIASRPQTVADRRRARRIWRGLRRGQIFPLNPLTGLLGFLGRAITSYRTPGCGG